MLVKQSISYLTMTVCFPIIPTYKYLELIIPHLFIPESVDPCTTQHQFFTYYAQIHDIIGVKSFEIGNDSMSYNTYHDTLGISESILHQSIIISISLLMSH